MTTFPMAAIPAAMPTPFPTRGLMFDDIIPHVELGDKLRCVEAITDIPDVGKVFTAGKEYEVITGEDLFTYGDTTIRDDNGVEVPLRGAPGRITILDRFEEVEDETVSVMASPELPTVFGEMSPIDRKVLLQGWKSGTPVEIYNDVSHKWFFCEYPSFMLECAYRLGKTTEEKRIEEIEAELADLRESEKSFLDALAKANSFDVLSEPLPFGELSREEKAELLLASHDGVAIQFHAPWSFGSSWESLAATPSWNREVYYRVEPVGIPALKAELEDLTDTIRELENELSDLTGESDELDW